MGWLDWAPTAWWYVDASYFKEELCEDNFRTEPLPRSRVTVVCSAQAGCSLPWFNVWRLPKGAIRLRTILWGKSFTWLFVSRIRMEDCSLSRGATRCSWMWSMTTTRARTPATTLRPMVWGPGRSELLFKWKPSVSEILVSRFHVWIPTTQLKSSSWGCVIDIQCHRGKPWISQTSVFPLT